MGKSSKKKKKKDADFVKPKLKVGKTKPNAANATNVAFKSSAISLLAQLEEKSEPTNRRNLSLKDLLSQLTHYNDNTRQDATQALKHFFIQYPTLLQHNLSMVMPKLLNKAVDSHFIVRKNFISCMEHILKNVTQLEIQPFFPIIMAHLNCALTHINEEIQADSLELLELCLDLFPTLFLSSCDKVLYSFLDLVSQSQTPGSDKRGKSRGISQLVSRDLSTKPSGKLSTMKTRINILEKLLKIIMLVFDNKPSTVSKTSQPVSIIQKNTDHMRNVVLLKYQLLDYDSIKRSKIEVSDSAFNGSSDHMKAVRKQILSFIPVLFRCWNDINPLHSTSSASDKSIQTTLPTMMTIALIMKGISSFSANGDNQDFANLHFEDFMKNVMQHFPINFTNIVHHKAVKNFGQGSHHDIVKLNICICHIFCKTIACKNLTVVTKNWKYIEEVATYVQSTSIDLGSKAFADLFESIQDVLCILVPMCFEVHDEIISNKDSSVLNSVYKILSNLTLIYKRSKNFRAKCMLLLALEKLLQLPGVSERGDREIQKTFERWLCLLPNDLVMAASDNKDAIQRIISLISTVLIKKQAPVQLTDNLASAVHQILDSPGSIFTMSQGDTILQRRFFELIYHLPNISRGTAEKLSFFCHQCDADLEVKQYVCHLLWYCYEKKRSITLDLFLSFSLSVILGSSMSNLERMQLSDKKCEWNGVDRLKYITASCYENVENETKRNTAHHVALCGAVLDILQSLDCGDRVFEIFVLPLRKVLLKCRILPEVTVTGLLMLFNRIGNFASAKEENKEFIDRLTEFIFSIIMLESRRQNSYEKSKSNENIDLLSIAGKIMEENDGLLRKFMEMALTEHSKGIMEEEIVAKSLWHLRRQQHLQVKMKKFLEDESYASLNILLNKDPLYIL